MRLLVLLLLMSSLLRAADGLTAETFATRLSRDAGYRYLLYRPEGSAADPARRWPVLLFLHGAGERGDDPWLVAKHGPPKLVRAGAVLTPAEQSAAAAARQFIIVSPQCPAGATWDGETLLALLDEVLRTSPADPARVYVSGLSMGGYGTWSLLVRAPGRFAAAVPICGGGQTIELLVAGPAQREALKTLGVWVFHGEKDPTVPVAESERMVAALRRAGHPGVRLTVYPEAKHDSWTATYADPGLYAWLLQHRR